MGEPERAGLVARERDGLRPRTTSSLRAEKKPCFFSMVAGESGSDFTRMMAGDPVSWVGRENGFILRKTRESRGWGCWLKKKRKKRSVNSETGSS